MTDYEGVSPGAKVYQIPILTSNDVIRAIDTLVNEYNVKIINYSGGSAEGTTAYTNFDQLVDEMIMITGVAFVVSAGNEGDKGQYVTSPGKAYNAITVGNAHTIGSNGTSLATPYRIAPSSSYAEKSYLTNKPDIVAPGTNIWCWTGLDELRIVSGTSLSAPIVTGIIAHLHQANTSLESDPIRTKAILLASADKSVVYDDYNNTHRFGEKSGVGLVNAANAVDTAIASKTFVANFNLNSATVPKDRTKNITLTAGQTIRFVTTWNKPDDDVLTEKYENDIDISLIDPNGNEVAYSRSKLYNVEVMQYDVTSTGIYRIVITLAGKDTDAVNSLRTCTAWHTYNTDIIVSFAGLDASTDKTITRGNTLEHCQYLRNLDQPLWAGIRVHIVRVLKSNPQL